MAKKEARYEDYDDVDTDKMDKWVEQDLEDEDD